MHSLTRVNDSRPKSASFDLSWVVRCANTLRRSRRCAPLWTGRKNTRRVLSEASLGPPCLKISPRRVAPMPNLIRESREVTRRKLCFRCIARDPIFAGVTFHTWVNFLREDPPKRRVNPFVASPPRLPRALFLCPCLPGRKILSACSPISYLSVEHRNVARTNMSEITREKYLSKYLRTHSTRWTFILDKY